MIYTSYYSNLRRLPYFLNAYSISKTCPKGFEDLPKIESVIPTGDILWDYKKNHNWELYKKRYFELLSKRSEQVLKDMNVLQSSDVPAVLLCWEKDSFTCHRSLLTEFLKEYKIYTLEYRSAGHYVDNQAQDFYGSFFDTETLKRLFPHKDVILSKIGDSNYRLWGVTDSGYGEELLVLRKNRELPGDYVAYTDSL